MSSHMFRLEELPLQPWKNGGGTTREIASFPERENPGDFDWRISIANIAASGPFSRYPGIDRSIALIAGEGIVMTAASADWTHPLDVPCEPYCFRGEDDCVATLLGQRSRDFNVMTRRGRYRHELTRITENFSARADNGAIFVVAGRWRDEKGADWFPGQGLWWQNTRPVTTLRAVGAAVALSVTIETEEA